MSRISGITLIFAIAFLIFFTGPALLDMPFPPYTLMTVGDIFDLFTPLVLIPLYWLLFKGDENQSSKKASIILFLILAALWAEGQGIHLAANSIGHLVPKESSTDIYDLTYFYDEILSHFMWHGAVIGLALLISWRYLAENPYPLRSDLRYELPAGVIHGLTFFMIIIEGGTAIIGLPFAVLYSLGIIFLRRDDIRSTPTIGFFSTAFVVASLLFLIWLIIWQGLPQFSELGWI